MQRGVYLCFFCRLISFALITQWCISALFSKRVNADVLRKRMLRLMMALESLLYESQTSNLTQAQNEPPISLPNFPHNLIRSYALTACIAPLFNITSLVYSDAPTSSTASTRSVILFNIHYSIAKRQPLALRLLFNIALSPFGNSQLRSQ